ncbi:hypothetical protein KJA17_01970 [Patescibacteria group bacterium]|nr:hypothetical protein [Patescibacteria group bacterium]
MPKKIFDIFPKKLKAPEVEKKEKKISFSLWWKIFIILGVLFGVIIFLTSQSKLDLKVGPYLESLSFEETFEVMVGAENVSLEGKIIPGRFFTQELEKWKQFESTGKSQKTGIAGGKIRVYNNHTPPTPVILRATTRFLSSENGKIFRCPEKIYLPSAKVSQGKVIPSSVEVEVEAQEPGEDYNIGPSQFSLPGLAGNPLYYTVYAESESPMTGGFKKEVRIVAAQDIENAKNSLRENLFREAKNSLRNKISEDFVLLEDAILTEAIEVYCLQKPETEIPEFSCQGKIKIKGLGFKLSDLKELSKIFIQNIIPPSEKLVEESLNFKYLSQNLVPGKGKMISDLKIEVAIYKNIPIATLSEQIEGKSKEEIQEIIFSNYPQVESIRIKFWPFWVRKAPKTSERIKIELTF